ncbi:hypothetical protein DM01DRAFT_1348728 [Hesseltinella vesiculosa]|uniref:Uncharacterized protein n=1 Tax=Hesseltinella vesiculosa TaxID=101127 RepID=A0A1X2G7V6_9FUNG|nr:hypothetical protein DM01DRAFT_1348728 [Hesseltinella vesiculosa]
MVVFELDFYLRYDTVTSPCYSGVQQEDGQADAVFLSSQANTRPNGIVFSASDRQLSPLAQAAWLHYVALFFDREGLAASIYDQIKTLYDCHQSNMEHVPDRPSIAWTVNNQKEWIIYHDLYYQQLTSDAGAELSTPSIPIQFHNDIHTADIVIDQTDLTALADDPSYDEWLLAGDFVPGTVSYDQPFIYQHTVYRQDEPVDDR